MTGLLIVGLLIAMTGVLAMCFGADTRDGQDWRQQSGQWSPPHQRTAADQRCQVPPEVGSSRP